MMFKSHKIVQSVLMATIAIVVLSAAAHAQTLRLRQVGSSSDRIVARVGETINIEVFADLQSVEAAGVSFFISIPDREYFQVSDFGLPGQSPGTQPFVQGPLLGGAQEPVNLLLPEDDVVAATIPGQQLDYQSVIGAGSNRSRTGSGVIATFSLLCLRPIENGPVRVDDNPIRETRLFLSDGVSTQRFLTVQGLEITTIGLELRDVPDVVLLPGEADSIQIGSLDRYIGNTLSPIDSMRWSFTPTDLDSLDITIDPVTRLVRIFPLNGWTGRQRIVWTATESQGVIVGESPLSASEISDIVVNNSPRFVIPRDADGVKRDTVLMVEDQHNFVAGGGNPDPRRALRLDDLDFYVDDPDITDPDLELDYVVTPINVSSSQANVLGDDDPATHELLVWTRRNFAGVDSLQIVVQDAYRGRDTLRVIVDVLQVPDPPMFILTDVEPKISKGSTKRYPFAEIVEDPDTELDSLLFSWVDDPEGHFTVDTTRVDFEDMRDGIGERVVEITGDSEFTGMGQVVLLVADPIDPENLNDNIIIYISSANALPPVVFPPDTKIDLTPAGAPVIRELDLFVEDPDHADNELLWEMPGFSTSQIGIDPDRIMQVGAPLDFVGYEEVALTVTDPSGQYDNLKLRIYSSDGRPVTGGMPDVVIDRGEEDRTLDLDDYYFDANNPDNEVTWQVLKTYDAENLTVNIDPLTHEVTYFAPMEAVFKTEQVIYRVTDPAGSAAEDTVLVTVRSGGAGAEGEFEFSLLPFLQAPVGQVVDVLDLDNFLTTSQAFDRASITWSITRNGSRGGTAILNGSVVKVFSEETVLDTFEFAAIDSLGRTEKQATTVRFFGANETLKLKPIPDIVFVAGQPYTNLNLSDFILDPETHSDSVISWSAVDIGGDSPIFIRVNDDNTVLALSTEVGETEIVFTARNSAIGVTGNDTVRVIALDPETAATELNVLPEIVLTVGRVDSSVILNKYIPGDITPSATNWLVSGQSICNPFIDPKPPHLLRLSSVGDRVGVDILTFVVDLGGGRTARGEMVVRVVEAIDATTLNIEIVPNPLNPNYLGVFLVARKELESSPTVVWSFEAKDSTVSVRQIEENFEGRGVLIWAGGVNLRSGASGTVLFSASALTELGSPVQVSRSISVGTTMVGKELALENGAAKMTLSADAVAPGTTVMLQSSNAAHDLDTIHAKGELVPVGTIDIYPKGLQLSGHGRLVSAGQPPNVGFYNLIGDDWKYQARANQGVVITQFGHYALMMDDVPPKLEILSSPQEVEMLVVRIIDFGSGVDMETVSAEIDGRRLEIEVKGNQLTWIPSPEDVLIDGNVVLQASDRVGNQSTRQIKVGHFKALPRLLSLGVNFPNPFNPETSIPVYMPSDISEQIAVNIYNVSGQHIRTLFQGRLEAGTSILRWNGKNDLGQPVGSGVYVCHLTSEFTVQTRRMTFLK